MRKSVLFCMLLSGFVVTHAQFKIGGKTIDTKKAVQAAKDVASAVTLSDADVAALCREAVEYMDANNPVADESSEYRERLAKLTQNIRSVNKIPLNFKVYYVADINAFACGDGSIRIFSALMDLMDDDELMAIIGHEIGHVAGTDTKDVIKNAYLTSAAMNAAGSASKTVSDLSETELAGVVKTFMEAQYSQKQEYAADDYGFKTCVDNGYSPYGMANALSKLVELSQGAKASAVQKMFSSHPDSEKRAARMKDKADNYNN